MLFSNNEISLEILGVFKLDRQDYNHKSHNKRAYDSISIRLEGSGTFETDGKTFEMKKGDILYIPKTAEYSQHSLKESVIAVHFINYSRSSDSKIEYISVEDSAFLEDIFRQMYDVWKEKKQGHRYLSMSLLYNLLYFLSCRENNRIIDSVTHDGKMNEVMDYIHENYRNSEIEVSQLAGMCAVSETYFRKLFKAIHGVSPVQYITALRLEFASHLLGSGLYTVAEVGQRSGFSDPKYFGRVFKKRYLVTPKKYQSMRISSGDIIE